MRSAAVFVKDLRAFFKVCQIVWILHIKLILISLLAVVIMSSSLLRLWANLIVKLLLEVLLCQLPLSVVPHLGITSKLLFTAEDLVFLGSWSRSTHGSRLTG